ncbi:MAG TPA: PQQ-dependent sugar dehydrogenase [Gemmatimonadaceae bacterium]|nr:PQQ-dependent sugar dehydrogenase [Gemmatimonadaceae bacterium]
MNARVAVHFLVGVGVMTSCRATTQPDPAPSAGATRAATPATPTLPAPEPSRFQQDLLLEGVFDEPTEIAVARDGRVFITERHGGFSMYDPRTRTQRQIAKLDVNDENENGLIGVGLDPDFDRNHWIYLNRTVGFNHRLARFTLDGDSLRDERVLLEVKIDRGCCHTGGSIAFDRAGNLFSSYGDNTNPFTAGDWAPIDPTPGKFLADALRSSGNTQDLRGKILRITPTADGKYTIPAGNLFATAAEGRPEIYVMGNRNPYRISVDKHTGFLYWGEVGNDARVDTIYGSRGYDEVNQARRAGNFGWPMFIGDNRPFRNYNFTTKQLFDLFDPKRPENTSPNNTGAKILPPPQPALIWYPYERSERFPLVGEGGRTAMAGPVYHFGDFAGSDVRLPEYYDGKLIHYEWMRGWMMATTLSATGDFVRMEPFLAHFKFDHPMDVEMGADGSLYVLEYGTYWNAKNPNARLSRITYHPGNRPPVARLVASRTAGAAPLTVELSADSSMDRDPGDSVRFTWSIPDAGDREGARVSHTFTAPGTKRVRLRVRDRAGAESEATTEILVGNAPPEVAIDVTGNRSFYWNAPSIEYAVRATDPEDGTIGRGIDASKLNVSLSYGPGDAAAAPQTSAGGQAASVPDGLARMRRSDCLACHGIDQASLGPAYVAVAQRYQGRTDAMRHLVTKIATGGTGVWGDRVMPPHPTLSEDDRRAMVQYILSLASSKLPARGRAALTQHAGAPGGAYRLMAVYADQPRNGVRSLADTAVVVLRAPRVLASRAVAMRNIGLGTGTGSDSTSHLLATIYADTAHLFMGALDLTGVSRVTAEFRSPAQYPFTLELRDGGPTGALLGSAEVRPATKGRWLTQSVPISGTGTKALYVVIRTPVQGIGQFNNLGTLDALRFEP